MSSDERGDALTIDELLARDDELFIQGAYRALLGREPDPEGLGNYMEQLLGGTPKIDLLAALALSWEGRTRAGALGDAVLKACERIRSMTAPAAASLDQLLGYYDERFVRCAYLTILGRDADREGLRHYVEELRAGFSKMSILSSLRASRESRARAAGLGELDGVGTPRTGDPGRHSAWLRERLAQPERQFVVSSYPGVLGRKAKPGEAAEQLRRLGDGMSRTQLLAALRGSEEGRASQGLLYALDAALLKFRWARLPILGRVLGVLLGVESDGGAQMRLRRVENELFLLAASSPGRSGFAHREAFGIEAVEASGVEEMPAAVTGLPEVLVKPSTNVASLLATLHTALDAERPPRARA
jgi:Domain of unknown function (DUF4214)